MMYAQALDGYHTAQQAVRLASRREMAAQREYERMVEQGRQLHPWPDSGQRARAHYAEAEQHRRRTVAATHQAIEREWTAFRAAREAWESEAAV